MKIELYNILSLIAQSLTAAGLVYFAWRQTQINKRMKDLADYVAISISPAGTWQVQILNVGRSNLYLHKWEIGSQNETFVKPLLMPVEGKSQILISMPPDQMGQKLAKFYLTDEVGEKYLATGEVVVEPTSVQVPNAITTPLNQNQSQETITMNNVPIQIGFRMRAWSYKTEKMNW